MSDISLEAYKKLLILSTIGNFRDGVMGRLRLLKTVYEFAKKLDRKPFPFEFYKHGQFSSDVLDTLDELEYIGLIVKRPLDGGDGFHYSIPEEEYKTIQKSFLSKLDKKTARLIKGAIEAVGYLPEKKLKEIMYEELKSMGLKRGDTIFECDITDGIDLSHLDNDEAENLELGLNIDFRAAVNKIVDTADKSKINLDEVEEVNKISDRL
jgi:uncharacterized protein YwgA